VGSKDVAEMHEAAVAQAKERGGGVAAQKEAHKTSLNSYFSLKITILIYHLLPYPCKVFEII